MVGIVITVRYDTHFETTVANNIILADYQCLVRVSGKSRHVQTLFANGAVLAAASASVDTTYAWCLRGSICIRHVAHTAPSARSEIINKREIYIINIMSTKRVSR